MNLLRDLGNPRARIAFAHDTVMAAVSYMLSLWLRLGDGLAQYETRYLVLSCLLFTVVAMAAFVSMRLYAGIWRYASTTDIKAITRAVTIALVMFLLAMFLAKALAGFPRSSLIINWFVLIALLGGPRYLYRSFKDRRAELSRRRGPRPRVPVLLVGAGDEAELFIRSLAQAPSAAYQVVGIVDDKPGRVGRSIHGVRVEGVVGDLAELVPRLGRQGRRPQRLILTKEHVDGAAVRRLAEIGEKLGVPLARLPRLTDFRNDLADRGTLRPIDIADLLGRPQAVLDRDGMRALIKGRRVLVTGAGGSIGAELARQIAAFAPARLALLDCAESLLYAIDLEISEDFPDLPRRAVLADIRDRGPVARALAEERPELVFHAAALKHVPIVEAQPAEGALTNAVGTRIVADACRAAGVRAMVLISTDKAVYPTSVMGATKRAAEAYCQALDIAAAEGTRFVTVRFGNVLGSTGSVVPLFERQIARGGPLTVTHPDMQRYFMTVREAVALVLQASALGVRGGEAAGRIYVLDMGEPVRIVDLARQMVLLAGLRPDEDIEIAFTGLRPGEKLVEQILHDSEPPVPTVCPGLLLAAPRTADQALLARAFDELESAARDGDSKRTHELLGRIVPEFRHGPADDTGIRAAE